MAESPNPFDTPSPRGIRVVQATLRVSVVLQCLAVAAAVLHLRRTLPVAELLGATYGIAPDQLAHAQVIGGYVLLASAALTLLRPSWFVLLPVTVLFAAQAITPAIQSSSQTGWLETSRWCASMAVPLALLFVDFWPPRMKPTLVLSISAIGLLRIACCVTYFAEGALAVWQFQQGGPLLEFVQLLAAKCGWTDLSDANIRYVVLAMGVVSLSLSLCLLTSRLKLVPCLMAIWGGALAGSQTLLHGMQGYDLTLARAADVAAPLCLLLFWTLSMRERAPEYLAGND